MALHNRVNNKLLKDKLQKLQEERTTLSFYKYHFIEYPTSLRDELYVNMEKLGVMGRIYVAHEGINAQISIPNDKLNQLKNYFGGIPFLSAMRLNIAIDDNGKSFFKLKIQIKNKIVADGLDDSTFNASNGGQHLNAQSFNKLTEDPSTLIVDMRNHYESEVGHFKNAICPDVDTFRDSLPVVEQLLQKHTESNIIMYCTGGIRCEKASAWFKHKGFKNVFQLEGGIIEYARQVSEDGIENKFIGKNFVFDERLGERISEEIVSVCHLCGKPSDSHTNCKNEACHLLFIQCEECTHKLEGCCSEQCKEINTLPEDQQKELRKGKAQGRMVYKKGRSEKILFKSSKKV